MRFDDLKLMPLLLQNVQAAGYETPTPIQRKPDRIRVRYMAEALQLMYGQYMMV